MRFSGNGPLIPDALLQARDEGRVVFLCGAGVSRARAGLPDFFGLAESVIRDLGVPPESNACKVLKKARELGEELDITGLISADRIFSLLEREFASADIQSAVAKCLKPPAGVDQSAHELLLRLARTPNGKTQIVTTNFDRLFEGGSKVVRIFQPPRLPDLSKYDDLDGIVYLHGRANADYTGADGEGFVLSSSDFGHAYLSEGWATEFFREIVRGYVVVLVGYSADDPPVHYLLEGLRRKAGSLNPIFAFQADESAELIARWEHKGVTAIPYSPADRHHALWEALEHWAHRADDPHAWQQSVLSHAIAGPRQLHPHERGQVAHIVSTYDGARAFSEAMPPAEWLCVFDPSCRYAGAKSGSRFDSESPTVEPFSLYGLDSDSVPQRNDEPFRFGRRETPTDAWNAFALNNADMQTVSRENLAAVYGHRSSQAASLPHRLACLGRWLARVANQPAAVWWAARQESMHPSYRQSIEREISHPQSDMSCVLQKAWQYILEVWNSTPGKVTREWFDLKKVLERDGWSPTGARRLINLTTPFLKVGAPLLAGPIPPELGDDFQLYDFVRIEVVCPALPRDAEVPNEWLRHVIRGLRTNLEAAARLCDEVDDMQRVHISPLERDDRPEISDPRRTEGLSGCAISFSTLFNRLIEIDLRSAEEELSAWPSDEDSVFARLRFWASGKPEVSTPGEFSKVLQALSDEVFWGSYHQRDLLMVLSRRWTDLSPDDRRPIEERLLRGPDRWNGEEDASYRDRRAWAVLERLHWLRRNGCEFTFDVESEMAVRRPEAPNWKPEYAERAAESHEIRGGFVVADTEFGPLMREPIKSVLSKAQELFGKTESILRERDPFAGLCAERPKRAYLALARSAKQGDYPKWAWTRFLESSARESDPSKFSAIVASRLCRLPNGVLSQLLYEATWWFQKVSQSLSKDFPDSFDYAAHRLIEVVQSAPASASSAVLGSNRGRDWVLEAINSPVGHLVRGILNDVRIDSPQTATRKPSLENIGVCMELPGEPRRHAITLAAQNLGWFHHIEPDWTSRHLLPILDSDDRDDRESFWAGVLSHPQIAIPELYARMKERLLEIAKQDGTFRQEQALAYLVLLGWISTTGDEASNWVSDAELRDVLLHGGDEFRSHVLWQFAHALSDHEESNRLTWQSRACEFFERAWPRQKSVKTPTMSGRLFELVLSRRDCFAALIDIVLPLVDRMTDATGLHIDFRTEVTEIINAHPERFLQLLQTILPEDVHRWPYGIGNTIEMIVTADGDLATDSRILDLRRKWNAR